MRNEIRQTSICKGPMGNKLGKVLPYKERLATLKPHEPISITWQIDKFLLLFLQDLLTLDLTGYGL